MYKSRGEEKDVVVTRTFTSCVNQGGLRKGGFFSQRVGERQTWEEVESYQMLTMVSLESQQYTHLQPDIHMYSPMIFSNRKSKTSMKDRFLCMLKHEKKYPKTIDDFFCWDTVTVSLSNVNNVPQYIYFHDDCDSSSSITKHSTWYTLKT